MHCEEFEARLNDLLDLRLDPADDRPLSEHAGGCRDCRRLLVAYGDALSALAELPVPSPPARLSDRVLACCQCDLPRPASGRARAYMPHLVAAAAVVVAALAMYLPQQHEPVSHLAQAPVTPVEPFAERQTAPPAPLVTIASDRPIEPWPQWTVGADNLFGDVASLWPQARWNARMTAAPDLDVERSPIIAEVATGLKPLAESATGAMSFLLDVLPANATAAAPGEVPVGIAPAGSPDKAI